MRNLVIVFLFIGISCGTAGEENTADSESDRAQSLIDEAIEASGGEKYLNSRIRFDFRTMSYVGTRKGGTYSYERIFSDSLGNVHDILTNEGFTRRIDGEVVNLADTMAQKYTNSVNSVLYFSLLPYGLNDPAVVKEYLGEKELKGVMYDKVKITFRQEGGGEDYQDVFVYWINQQTRHIDYFGYTYETDGGGKRFRQAYNPRVVNGIRFQDYVNFEPGGSDETGIADFDSLYVNGLLDTLSLIELKNIEVDIDPSI